MKRHIVIITGIAILLSVAGISAFAHDTGWERNRGYGHMMGTDDWGPGWHHRGMYGHGQEGYYGNFSEEERAKWEQQRSEFLKATETIRQNLYEKERALRNELAKEDPDINRASKLQSEISKLQGELDQKQLNYEIKARKNAPDYHRDYGGYGPMMGYGSRGGGYCRW